MFATKDDTFSKSFVERDNIAELEKDIGHDTAQVDTIYNNVINGTLALTTAKTILEDENERYIDFLDFLSSIDSAFTREFNEVTLPFIYNDCWTINYDDLGRKYTTSKIKFVVGKDGDIFDVDLTDWSILETDKPSNENEIPPFNTITTFNKDLWEPAERKNCYIFTEEAYNRNVAWVNDICDKQAKESGIDIPLWRYCWKWQDVVSYAFDIMRIRHKIYIIESFQQKVLQKAIKQLTGNGNATMIPPAQAEQTDDKTNIIHSIKKTCGSRYSIVCKLCENFEDYTKELVINGYITIDDEKAALSWDFDKTTRKDFAHFFKRIKKVGKGVEFWTHIVYLFGLAQGTDEARTEADKLTQLSKGKDYYSDKLDVLLSFVVLKKKNNT